MGTEPQLSLYSPVGRSPFAYIKRHGCLFLLGSEALSKILALVVAFVATPFPLTREDEVVIHFYRCIIFIWIGI